MKARNPQTARVIRGPRMERPNVQVQWDDPRHSQARHSICDVAEDPHQRLSPCAPTTRKRADSHQPQTTTTSSPRVRSSSDVDQLPQQALISAYLRSSYQGDDRDRPRRFSSAAEHNHPPAPPHHNSQGEMRRISGNFNAPTEIEVERQKDHKKRSRAFKSFVCDTARILHNSLHVLHIPTTPSPSLLDIHSVMDHYPEVRVNERETPTSRISSRHDSASSVAKAAVAPQSSSNTNTQTKDDSTAPRSSSYHSFPSPSTHSSDLSAYRSNSSSSANSNLQRIEAEYARYTDAPPPYSEKQYEGKTNDEQTSMRMTDYAKELSRMMGRQLVRGLKIDERQKGRKEGKTK
ncbi:hypothetical protein DDE82_002626 [Stemphylium lycopersici]|uniref:Uncharacterized protein n=1 Tax=Stemphylium lycopersici TaxID=183478 RepID=A0A364NCH7_STELY|nr:hypothetical protein DDE82_002626 [Stemphylium lycopersici]RAR15044.1 hypothetical protein DDE83_001481 [Stemphylium lycopersici]